MRVLIVEDDDAKRAELVSFIRETYAISDLQSARSFQSGLKAILEQKPDFVVLDMTMRNFDRSISEEGGRPHPFAGREVLRQMRRYRLSAPVLVVTQFDRFGEESDYTTLRELEEELRKKFSNYIGTIQFRSNVDDWKPAMRAAIGARLAEKHQGEGL